MSTSVWNKGRLDNFHQWAQFFSEWKILLQLSSSTKDMLGLAVSLVARSETAKLEDTDAVTFS